MARFMPSAIDDGASGAERSVWNALSALNDDWTIHHSVEWVGERDGVPDDGEADFVLVHPDHGVIVMEVKGGREIRVSPEGWVSVSHDNSRHRIRNPFKQVQESKRALIRFLKTRLVASPRIPFGHVVVFPSIHRLPALGPEVADEIAWRRQELENLEEAVPVLLEHWRMSPPIGPTLAAAINSAIAPEGVIRASLADDVSVINSQITAWTSEQAAFLEGAADNDRLLVFGGAGSGKTVLAQEFARRASDTRQSSAPDLLQPPTWRISGIGVFWVSQRHGGAFSPTRRSVGARGSCRDRRRGLRATTGENRRLLDRGCPGCVDGGVTVPGTKIRHRRRRRRTGFFRALVRRSSSLSSMASLRGLS